MNNSRKSRRQLLDDLQELGERTTQSEETLRTIFIGLSSGILAAAGWVTAG